MTGIIEDLIITKIKQSSSCLLRSNVGNIKDLATSIQQKGLLQPIIVRSKGEDFEVVAGNRRLNACRMLGWRKVPCHVVELDDRGAFEVALIENIQRQTLNPMEEALSFKTYVTDFGWGGVSQLAEKLGKSPSYVTKRIRLLDLPLDIRDYITNSTISPSVAEELISVKDSGQQSELANLVYKRRLSLRKVRALLNDNDEEMFDGSIFELGHKDEAVEMARAFDKSIIGLRLAMNRISSVIESVEDKWIVHQVLMEHKIMLHSQIDLLMKERKKLISNQSRISQC